MIGIRDVPAVSSASSPTDLIEFDGGLYFTAFTDAGTKELHRLESDGTLSTVQVNPDGSPSGAGDFFVLGDDLYFVASRPAIAPDPATGTELFRLNGEDGTFDVIDINPGATSSGPKDFVEFNGDVYFLADTPDGDNLLKLDGDTGLVTVVDIGPPLSADPLPDPDPDDLTVAGDSLYFAVDHPTAGGDGLYQLDADGAVPIFIGDVLEAETDYENFSIAGTFGDQLILEARHETTGEDGLFTYDGASVAFIQDELFANNFASFEGDFAVV
ncbi:MAG: hypothetical protein GY791_13330 [Alphaproteobacteria bacterium]|nr:hypothetical protein [Alphaproteobacteria bacterium]